MGDKPTGRYRSFHQRGWPTATYKGQMMVFLTCPDEYIPARVKVREHSPITIVVCHRPQWLDGGWERRKLLAKGFSLDEAKQIAEDFFEKNKPFFGVYE